MNSNLKPHVSHLTQLLFESIVKKLFGNKKMVEICLLVFSELERDPGFTNSESRPFLQVVINGI